MMARREHPGQQNNLDALCRRYFVNNKHRDFHGALKDAELLAQVYLQMTGGQTQLFANQEIETAEEKQNNIDNKAIAQAQKRILKVIKANAQELKEHEEFFT